VLKHARDALEVVAPSQSSQRFAQFCYCHL
jgi:hypothetical protein